MLLLLRKSLENDRLHEKYSLCRGNAGAVFFFNPLPLISPVWAVIFPLFFGHPMVCLYHAWCCFWEHQICHSTPDFRAPLLLPRSILLQ